MTDPNPLLLKQYEEHYLSLDDTIEHCIGDFGWKQMFQAALISLAWFFDAQQAFVTVFTDIEPKRSCSRINNNNSSSCSSYNNRNLCEWSLKCAGSVITGLPASSFFFGSLVGGFTLATLADSSLGRKNMLVLSSLLMSLAGLLTTVSTNLWMYVLLRFIGGFGRATVATCALVLSSELVGKKWRGKIGIVGFTFFMLGFLSLPAIAYSLAGKSWRLIYLWISVPSVFYSLMVYFLVCESPRWLFVKGRKEEFAETLRSIAPPNNRRNLTERFFRMCKEWDDVSSKETNIFSAMRILLRKKWAWQRLFGVMVVGFGIGMMCYAMPLGLGNLSSDPYLSGATLNALSEFPTLLLTFLVIEKLERKFSVLGLSVVSGVCSVVRVLVGSKEMQVGLEIVSFFSARSAFDVVLIYTLELFPTCARNSAVSMVRQALVFGGVLSPLLVAVGRKNGLMLSYGVFGVMILVCGLFVAWLPETRGAILCDTVEEEERKLNVFENVICV